MGYLVNCIIIRRNLNPNYHRRMYAQGVLCSRMWVKSYCSSVQDLGSANTMEIPYPAKMIFDQDICRKGLPHTVADYRILAPRYIQCER